MRNAGSSVALAIALAGCVADRVASFALGEEIPLGIIDLEVNGWEVVPGSRPPLSSLRPPVGDKAIAVFVRWSGLEEMGTMDTRNLIETLLEHRLTLIDSGGHGCAPVHAMPRDFYYGSSYALGSPPDWVVVFHVGVDRGGLSLQVEHPDPGEDDFQVAAVPLD